MRDLATFSFVKVTMQMQRDLEIHFALGGLDAYYHNQSPSPTCLAT